MSEIRRRSSYAVAGALLSLGAPIGLLAIRTWRFGFSPRSLQTDLAGEAPTYVYVAFTTGVAFSLFGFVVGSWADRLTRISNTDPLTGLWNARLLRDRLTSDFAHQRRYGSSLSLLLLDLDDLKLINDRRGHAAGDEALRRVAAALQQDSRATDIAARFGGDEFALLAPHTDSDAALLLAERIQTTLAQVKDDMGAVTVSIGVATVEPQCALASPAALLALADRSLYEAKRLGKNCVRAS
jgi:diguanylate cyclase (GGDEF)-like protein